MKTYTLQEVRDILGLYGSGIDPFEDEDLDKVYVETECSTYCIVDEEEGRILTIDNWLEHKSIGTINGESWTDTEDLNIIRELMHRYSTGLEVFPILVDRAFYIVDGSHRLAALNTLGIKTARIFYPVG